MRGNWRGFRNVDWALWFALSSPVLGVLLGTFGVFVLTH